MENDFETPFHPNPMRTSNDSHRMLYLYGSEYLFNSLLYHAYEDDRLIVEVFLYKNIFENFLTFHEKIVYS